MTSSLDVIAGLVLEDGSRIGESKVPWQWEFIRAVDERPGGIHQFWPIVPRGGYKTTTDGGIVTSELVVNAPAGSRSYIGAADLDQAAEVIDCARGLIERTPGLADTLVVRDLVIANRATGATVEALPADASAFGKRPWLIVLDEPTNWPETRSAKKFWDVMTSAARKLPGCRLLVTSNAGTTEHWTAERWRVAVASPHWWTLEVPGPLPWLSEADVDALRENATTPSEFERLVLGRWTSGDDKLVRDEDLQAAATLDGPVPARAGARYVLSFDLGLVNDRTVVCVAHRERGRVVVDRLLRWQGSRALPVQLGDVEAALLDLWRSYGRPRLIGDPWQAAAMVQRLRAVGVRVEEYAFTASSVGRVASVLHRLLRDHEIDLPIDDVLLDELRRVRLRSNSLGTVRLDHDSGGHDDQAVAIGLCAQALVTRSAALASVESAAGTARIARGPNSGNDGAVSALPRGAALDRRRLRVEAPAATSPPPRGRSPQDELARARRTASYVGPGGR